MPLWLPYKAGEQFAVSKLDWITAQRAKTAPSLLAHGQRIGKAHRLYFEPGPDFQKVSTRLVSGEIRVSYPAQIAHSHLQIQQAARNASLRALRKEAELLLPQRLRSLAAKTGLDYSAMSIKHLKSRWGSCSSTKEITLNLFLMQLPWHLIDYVILHELTHTKVMQHGKPFWDELERYSPDARSLRKEINQFRPAIVA